VEDDQVFLVSADSLARPVERACDEDLTINQAVLVVHVSVRVVIHGGGDTVKAKSPHISPVELSALIIDNQPALDTFLECMRDSIRQLVVRECEHTNVKGLLCSTNNLCHLDDVSLRWETSTCGRQALSDAGTGGHSKLACTVKLVHSSRLSNQRLLLTMRLIALGFRKDARRQSTS